MQGGHASGVPTIEGLIEAGTNAARRMVELCNEVLAALKRAYRERPNAKWTSVDLAASAHMMPGTFARWARWGSGESPVENQNDQHPPKYVVADLFSKYLKRKYNDTTGAPWILERASLATVAQACAQRFAPLVDELRTLASGQTISA